MKITNQREVEEYSKALIYGGLKGVAIGAIGSLGAYFYLRRRMGSALVGAKSSGLVRNLVYVSPPAFVGVTFAEIESRRFETRQREMQFVDGSELKSEADPAAQSWDSLSNFFGDHKYKFVVGGWAASMAGSFYLVNRDKYMTKAQKVVQARVYAQGLTVALLLATVLLSVGPKKSKEEQIKEAKQEASKSWERDIAFVTESNHHDQKSSSQ